MRLTEKARAVLEAARKSPSGIGANFVAGLVGISCGHKMRGLRGGQYAGRLINEGWLKREIEEYRDRRGYRVYCAMSYHITDKGRAVLRDR